MTISVFFDFFNNLIDVIITVTHNYMQILLYFYINVKILVRLPIIHPRLVENAANDMVFDPE
jgi:hypothetical protein